MGMARKWSEADCLRPDAVEYLAGLPEEEAAAHSPLFRKRDEGGDVL